MFTKNSTVFIYSKIGFQYLWLALTGTDIKRRLGLLSRRLESLYLQHSVRLSALHPFCPLTPSAPNSWRCPPPPGQTHCQSCVSRTSCRHVSFRFTALTVLGSFPMSLYLAALVSPSCTPCLIPFPSFNWFPNTRAHHCLTNGASVWSLVPHQNKHHVGPGLTFITIHAPTSRPLFNL